ncbi:hypothetical protein [Ensifer sp. Root558]|uniref:hypothetical protein n=1 Tax=Ensifer sp. Root558 TaxID=1736558 RepID=UPI00138F2FE1|nr:hypothetical protein [Ensifer sp. Root558]
MRAAVLIITYLASIPHSFAGDRPFGIVCEAGRWQGYSVTLDQTTGEMQSEEDAVGFSETMYKFHEDGKKVEVTNALGSAEHSIVRNYPNFRTVAYHYGQDYVVDTVFDDGFVVEKYTRTLLRPTSYTFRKKCTPLR